MDQKDDEEVEGQQVNQEIDEVELGVSDSSFDGG